MVLFISLYWEWHVLEVSLNKGRVCFRKCNTALLWFKYRITLIFPRFHVFFPCFPYFSHCKQVLHFFKPATSQEGWVRTCVSSEMHEVTLHISFKQPSPAEHTPRRAFFHMWAHGWSNILAPIDRGESGQFFLHTCAYIRSYTSENHSSVAPPSFMTPAAYFWFICLSHLFDCMNACIQLSWSMGPGNEALWMRNLSTRGHHAHKERGWLRS